MTDQLARKPYPSDVTDEQWELLAPLIPGPGAWSPREPIPRREIVNGILYVLRTGCSWRQMPHDLPNGKTVYHYFRQWKLDGTWERAMNTLRRQVRTQMGRDPEPSAVIIDSQSIKTSPVRGEARGFDSGKKNLWPQTPRGTVDTLGLLLAIKVHSAELVDRWGALVLLHGLADHFPRMRLLFADRAYAGQLIDWIKASLGWDTEIVPKPERWACTQQGELVRLPTPRGGFQVQHHRWKVERTLGWLIRYRRLARDYEGLPSSSEALIQVAAIRLFLTRLTPFRSIRT